MTRNLTLIWGTPTCSLRLRNETTDHPSLETAASVISCEDKVGTAIMKYFRTSNSLIYSELTHE
jgi:hypothetical protein